ncbi:MAG TPA: hypothetical protein VGP17_08710 [Solirubrobacteraceae bacterium]|nr:hypothetical protein [Solirubrobacteraceae bacterium]
MESRLFVWLAALATVLAVAACGSSSHHAAQPQGYLNMQKLSQSVKAGAWFGPPGHRHYPVSVTCTKTGTLEAVCVPIYKEADGPEAGTGFKEQIAPNGASYKSEGVVGKAAGGQQDPSSQTSDLPGSHEYPAAVRAAFLHGCETTSGHEDAACECAIKRIEAKVSLGRYRQNEAEVGEGKPLPFIYNFDYGYCAGKNAAEGGG